MNGYPIHVVTEWLGNSPDVARKHYLQTHEGHFQRAVEKRWPNSGTESSLNAAAEPCTDTQEQNKETDLTPCLATACDNMREDTNQDNLYLIPPRGLEPLGQKQQANTNKELRGSQGFVLSTSLDKTLQKYPDLQQIVSAWPNLPEHIKAAVKVLVQTHITEKK